jgi:hypothetical protein
MTIHPEQADSKSLPEAKADAKTDDHHSALLAESLGVSGRESRLPAPAQMDVKVDRAALLNQNDKMSLAEKTERLGLVSVEGLAYSVPGALHAIEHDLDPANWKETGIKILSAGLLGAATRLALPEAGALKAIAGTAMAAYFLKDAARPIFSAWSDVTSSPGEDVMNQAARKMGDGIGAFVVDGYLSSKIAACSGRLVPALGERFAPAQWEALEAWKFRALGPSSMLDTGLNGLGRAVNSAYNKIAGRFSEPEAAPNGLTAEQVLESISRGQKQGDHARYSQVLYTHGMPGSNGLPHGLDETVDLLLMGKDPRKVPAKVPETDMKTGETARIAVELPDSKSPNTVKFKAAETGAELRSVQSRRAGRKAASDGAASGNSVESGKPFESGRPVESGKPVESSKPAESGKPAENTGPVENSNPVESYLNAENMTVMSAVMKAEIEGFSGQAAALADRSNTLLSVVHAATDPRFKPLDPGYLQARDAMIQLAADVGLNPEEYATVDPLFNRLGDATLQAHTGNLSNFGEHVAHMNRYASENQSYYVLKMISQGIDPEQALSQKPLPPLVTLNDDQVVISRSRWTGKVKVIHEGPNTIRAIYGPDGEPIWPVDLIKNPMREIGIRGFGTTGIYAHELMHNQFGQLGKFDPGTRDARLLEAANNALGADAETMIDLPKKTALQVKLSQFMDRVGELGKILRNREKPAGGSVAEPVAEPGAESAGPNGGAAAPEVLPESDLSPFEALKAVLQDEAKMPPLPAQMSKGEVMANIAKAWADEVFADWGAASESGQTAAPYFQMFRKDGRLSGKTVMSEEWRSPENPLGIEEHPVDKLRPRFQAALIRKMATAGDGPPDELLLNTAAAMEKYSRQAGVEGDIVIASVDHPGQKVTISEADFDRFIPALLEVQLQTPLPRLQGRTLQEILPDLTRNMHKNDHLSDLWVDAIANDRTPDSIPFETSSVRMSNIYGAGQPALLKLISLGAHPLLAAERVNEFSDYFANRYLDGDPHVYPVKIPVLRQLQLAPARTLSRLPHLVAAKAGETLAKQYELRKWLSRNTVSMSGASGSLLVQDLLSTGTEDGKGDAAAGR